jgi:hypothetical protein
LESELEVKAPSRTEAKKKTQGQTHSGFLIFLLALAIILVIIFILGDLDTAFLLTHSSNLFLLIESNFF